MKRWSMVAAGMLMVISLTALGAVDVRTNEDEANTLRQGRSADMWLEKWSFKMCRGVINLATCWVELPRCIYVETSDNAIIGPLKGVFKGLGLTVVRASAGALDLVTFGTVDDTYSVYDRFSFPYFVWRDWSSSDRQ